MKLNFVLTFLHFFIFLASAGDTLLPGQLIRDGETLVSTNGTFALGFFSPGTPGNSNNRYVGIWYHNMSEMTVVWVANRGWPLGDTSNNLTFASDGNLMIVDGRGATLVFTSGSATTNNITAQILDSGNLVLRDARGRIWWQSFDNPTDHILPGMKLGIFGGQNRLLSSWRSPEDPSTGDFSFGKDPNRVNEFFIWKQSKIYWETGPWIGNTFSLIPEMAGNSFINLRYVSSNGSSYLTYTQVNGITRLTLNQNGQLSLFMWEQTWRLVVAYPRYQCDVFNPCGSFGVCNYNQQTPCECVNGFQPGSLSDWRNGVTSGGCVRDNGLLCQSGGKPDEFQAVPGVVLPVDGTKFSEVGATQCESACLKNCSCTAYSFTDTCQLWYGDIPSLKQPDDGGYSSVATLYLRLAASESEDFVSGNDKKLKIIVPVTVIFVLLSLISLGSFLCWRRHKGREKLRQQQSLLLLGADIANKLGENDKSAAEFTFFDFLRVAEATNNFRNENKLGEGGFGPVYKGMLAEGKEIAVKRLSAQSGQGLEEFKNEILLIARLQHSNLVRLLGCCIQKEEKILIYEYMHNKSLDCFLFDQERDTQLDWTRRLHIIEGIAQGLIYLHKHSRLRIIHRDLKASNVLLDAEMNAKISDFGMARIFNPKEKMTNTIRVVGTYGYMSPEYVAEGLFSVKSDVFSFGVLLLEIVSGKRNSSVHQYKDAFNLVGYAWELWLEGTMSNLMDPLLGSSCPVNEVTRCVHVGLLCVQENAADRPTMTEVITMLSSQTAALTSPKQPAFFTMRVPRETDLPWKSSSLNILTVTSMDGR